MRWQVWTKNVMMPCVGIWLIFSETVYQLLQQSDWTRKYSKQSITTIGYDMISLDTVHCLRYTRCTPTVQKWNLDACWTNASLSYFSFFVVAIMEELEGTLTINSTYTKFCNHEHQQRSHETDFLNENQKMNEVLQRHYWKISTETEKERYVFRNFIWSVNSLKTK